MTRADCADYYSALPAPVLASLADHPNSYADHNLSRLAALTEHALSTAEGQVPRKVVHRWRLVLDNTGSWITEQAVDRLCKQYLDRKERKHKGCSPPSTHQCPFKVASQTIEEQLTIHQIEKEVVPSLTFSSTGADGAELCGKIVSRPVPDEDIEAGLVPAGLQGHNEAIAACDVSESDVVGVYNGVFAACASRTPAPVWSR